MGKKYSYNSQTKKVEVTEVPGSNGNGRSQVGISWYAIKDQVKKDLLAFAREDDLPLKGTDARSTAALIGRACNAYVAPIVEEFIRARKAMGAKAPAPEKPKEPVLAGANKK